MSILLCWFFIFDNASHPGCYLGLCQHPPIHPEDHMHEMIAKQNEQIHALWAMTLTMYPCRLMRASTSRCGRNRGTRRSTCRRVTSRSMRNVLALPSPRSCHLWCPAMTMYTLSRITLPAAAEGVF